MTVILLAQFLLAVPDAPQPAKMQPPVVKFQGVVQGQLRFEVTNPNDAVLPYSGYTANSFDPPLKAGTIFPLYALELLKANTWKPNPVGWCGFGVGPVTIPAKGKVTFDVPIPDGPWDEVRVGMKWSQPADPKAKPILAVSDAVRRTVVMPKKP